MPNYKFYQTRHPDDKAHGGTPIIVNANTKHYESNSFCESYIQATTIVIADRSRSISVAAVYCSPKHNITKEEYMVFFSTLGRRFIAGAACDYNAKHHQWDSRLITPKGHQL